MAKIKVAFLSFFYPGINPYGSSRYSTNILKGLSKIDSISVDFYCPYPIRNFEKIKNINYIFVPFRNIPLIKFFSFTRNLKRMLDKNSNQPDIIHSNSGSGFFLKNVDIETFHHYEPFNFKDLMVSLSYILSKFSLHKARHIITSLERAIEDLVIKEKIERERISLIYNPIDFKKFFKTNQYSEFKKKFVLNPEEKLLLSIGPLLKRKNLNLSIKTLNYLLNHKINARLLIIGKGDIKFELESFAEKLGIKDKVNFLNYVKDMTPFYNIVDVLLIPSVLEGFGYLYLEGPACGVKFIGFDTGIASMVAKYHLGKIAINEIDFMKQTLEALNNEERVSSDAYDLLSQNFSLDDYGERIFDIYKKYIIKNSEK